MENLAELDIDDMPFSSQFALSLELTRLLPIVAKPQAVEELIKLARRLQVGVPPIIFFARYRRNVSYLRWTFP